MVVVTYGTLILSKCAHVTNDRHYLLGKYEIGGCPGDARAAAEIR